MKYSLETHEAASSQKKTPVVSALKSVFSLMSGEKKALAVATLAMVLNSAMNLAAPMVMGRAIDAYILTRQYPGVVRASFVLLVMYLVAFVASYLQTRVMGGVGQRVLFHVRNTIFSQLQQLPMAFFTQNRAGDLISRINNDTEKLQVFFSQSLVQFMASVFIMAGAAISLLVLHAQLGLAALVPAIVILVITQAVSSWVKRQNVLSMQTTGKMGAEIQQGLDTFKVIAAFRRGDYFRSQFDAANQENYRASIRAGLANTIFVPLYGLASMVAQLIVLAYGISLILAGRATVGLVITFLTYVMRFYDPLRQFAALWNSFQVALASWDRVSAILTLKSDMVVVPSSDVRPSTAMVEFHEVSFGYPDGAMVLERINMSLEQGKTYALVGPTGGGKTTTASLIARLFDPTSGTILFHGRDLRSYEPLERAKKIGFILQEPCLFSGTVRDNILYGHTEYRAYSNIQLEALMKKEGLEALLQRFDGGLEATVSASGEGMSLGQKQLIAFIRAVLRHPDILILDEATANIDTVTEQLLEDILKKLPSTTTRIIIAHRLNTIANADEIFFVNAGRIEKAGSMEHAVDLLLHGKRQS